MSDTTNDLDRLEALYKSMMRQRSQCGVYADPIHKAFPSLVKEIRELQAKYSDEIKAHADDLCEALRKPAALSAEVKQLRSLLDRKEAALVEARAERDRLRPLVERLREYFEEIESGAIDEEEVESVEAASQATATRALAAINAVVPELEAGR